ncbi:MAG: DUF4350 domain-containing protein [Sulfolobales archaeon]
MRNKLLLAVALSIFLVLPLAVEKDISTRVPSGASPFNTGPEGTSGLVSVLINSGFNVTIARSWSSDLRKLSPCLIVVVSPELPYSSAELSVIRELVNQGSNILVADEGTYSNAILEYLGVPARISGRVLTVGGRAVFTSPTRLGSTELNVVYAYSSSIDVLESVNRAIDILAQVNGDVLAIAYKAPTYSAVVVSDGTILTNALLNPTNVLNHNYVFAYYIAKNMCSSGTILVEGSKYELRPYPALGVEVPIVAYLHTLSRVLSATLAVLVVFYVVLPKFKTARKSRGVPTSQALGSYEVARILCQDVELSTVLTKECDVFKKTRRAQQFLSEVVALMKKDRELASKVLKAIVERAT